MRCETRPDGTGPAHQQADAATVQVLHLHAEAAAVIKRTRQTLVRVTSTTACHDEPVAAELAQTQVIVDRVPIGRIVEAVPPVRVEGGVTIMPVVEEELVLVRRLVLKEEVHLRTVRSVLPFAETVTLRRQDVLVTRTELGDANPPGSKMAAATEDDTMTDQDQTIVAIYDTPAHAELAVQDLLQAGVPETAVHRHAQEGSYTGRAAEATTRTSEGTGFWASLFGGEPDHDATVYDRSVQSGGNAVSVHVPDTHVTKVMDILESHNPIDIDERAESYGLTKTTQASLPSAGRTSTGTGTGTGMAGVGLTGSGTALGTDGGKLQLSEETLAVGKRVVNQGTTRIRRFVVETPVEQSVSLHDERVTIERRPVTDGRPVADSFSEKTIEMTESAEEAVVSKTARVVEEVALHKEAADRTETVRDTVRREDVEIVKSAGDTSTPARKPLV